MKNTKPASTKPAATVGQRNTSCSADAISAAAGVKNGSVNIAAFGVPVNIVLDTKSSNNSSDFDQLVALEQARTSWEHNELAASSRRLYMILTKAYGYYCEMKQNSNEVLRKQKLKALDQFVKERSYTFMPSTHDMTRVVKCVFGVDRRRVSAYSIALREALRQEIAAADLTQFIEINGGVEQIRLGFAKPLSASRRADSVRDQVLSNEIARIRIDPKFLLADADWADKQVILVATYLPTGELLINTVVKNDSAVNAALAAVYSNERSALRLAAKDAKETARVVQKLAKLQKQPLVGEAKKEAEKKKVSAAQQARDLAAHQKQQYSTLFPAAAA